ncbi:MAG: hypothetical protein ACYCTF_04950 [Acidiferrobacter sp.]
MGVAEQVSPEDNAEFATAPANPYVEEALSLFRKVSAYVSEHDAEAMRRDLERRIRDHPGASIAIGFAVGVILGKFIQR